ncbi:MAG: hypothetical protein KBD78_04195 [Oligoflexales bacterium]|nr:hypothetical protein [Oligoflexales bacterium]
MQWSLYLNYSSIFMFLILTNSALANDTSDWTVGINCQRTQTLAEPLNLRILKLIVDPQLSDGRTARQASGQLDIQQEFNEQKEFFERASCNRLNINSVGEIRVNYFPVKQDGFQYSSQSWLDVMSGRRQPHPEDKLNYDKLIAEQQLCSHANRLNADEFWVYSAPWVGFYESAQISGPNTAEGFVVNGPVFRSNCNKLTSLGIAGGHTFGHRAEATLSHVFGGWKASGISHHWDGFGLNKAQAPNYASVGCGSIHYAPNSTCAPGINLAICQGRDDDYEYNLTNTQYSFCDSFLNYPNINFSDGRWISCVDWGCNAKGHEAWWWNHLPMYRGVQANGLLNDWWRYVFDPSMASRHKGLGSSSLSSSPPNNPSPAPIKPAPPPRHTNPAPISGQDCKSYSHWGKDCKSSQCIWSCWNRGAEPPVCLIKGTAQSC